MKTIFFDCSMGAAGDMLTAALLELHPDPAGFVDRLNNLGLSGVEFRAEPSVKCGIKGTHMRVLVHGEEEHEHTHEHHHDHEHEHHHDHEHEHHHDHEHEHHHHNNLHGIEHLVRDHMGLPEAVQADVLAVYGLIAAAESKVHGVPVEQVHFHEVGALDAVADVTAVCLLLRELAPARILASPVHVGSGQVLCAHGLMPVPAPATAELLKDVPIYGGEIRGELCTPTGAALLKYYVNQFGPMPAMRTQAVGYGMGTKDFPAANCVRAILGETAKAAEPAQRTDAVTELRCNLDDMTAEEISFAAGRLLDAGALDVWTQPIGMKKGRPGTMLCVLCKPVDQEAMTSLLFRYTTTLGVRACPMERAILDRTFETLETPQGPVRRKTASGWGVQRSKYEYEDLARIAAAEDLSIEAVRARLSDPE